VVAKKLDPYLSTLQSGKRVNSQDIPQAPGVEKKQPATTQHAANKENSKKPAAPAASVAASKPATTSQTTKSAPTSKTTTSNSEGDTDTWIPVNEIVSNGNFFSLSS